MEENLHGFGFGDQFLHMLAKAQSIKTIIDRTSLN